MPTPWTEEHTIIVLAAYCRVPFNKASNNNPEIMRVAELLNRSTNSVKMKIGNFGSFDPELKRRGIVGLTKTTKLDSRVWGRYFGHWDELAYDSEALEAQLRQQPIEALQPETLNIPAGVDRQVWVKQRINQRFFREAVLSSYTSRCCITGLAQAELLEACHIIGWANDEANRTNPSNGLCMNALFHKAYDKDLIGITPDYSLCISERLMEHTDGELQTYFSALQGKTILLPNRFMPDCELLDLHYQRFLAAR